MFQIVAVPFEAYAALPCPQHRWLLTCLARYADRQGSCWPSMRQLAVDARMSLATVCRRLAELAQPGVFQRERLPGGGRYRYTSPSLTGRAGPSVFQQRKTVFHRAKQQNKQDQQSTLKEGDSQIRDRASARSPTIARNGGRRAAQLAEIPLLAAPVGSKSRPSRAASHRRRF